MTSSDSTPDFSWLNKNDEANEEADREAAQVDQPESLTTDGSETNDAANDEDSADTGDNPAEEAPAEEASEVPELFTPTDSLADADTPSDDADASAETPTEDEQAEGEQVENDQAEGGNSVFDDDSDDSLAEVNESNEPTLIMPGRQLNESENPVLNSSNQPEDLTVVLPPENPADPLVETFAAPESDSAVEDSAAEDSAAEDSAAEDSAAEGSAAEGSTVEDSTVEDSTVESEPGLQLNFLSLDSNENSESTLAEEAAPDVEETLSAPASAPTESDSTNVAPEESLQAATEETTAPTVEAGESASRSKLILLVSYASVMTLIALFLLMKGGGATPQNEHLESLPDVAPEPVGKLTYVPVRAKLPGGHLLKLGEKQRFGNIEVEPLRVVHEPIEFSHYDSTSRLTRPPSEPVIKLWIRFTNVSKDQVIAPLDGDLLLRWVMNSEQQREFSNQYLFADGASQPEDEISTYRHSKESNWDLKEQSLGQTLEPGESYETYIASTEELPAELPENLNWRIQFRKGFSPNGNGVTTVIDIAFHKKEIKSKDQPS